MRCTLGWHIVVLAMLGLAINANASMLYAFGTLVIPLQTAFGWVRGDLQAAVSFLFAGAVVGSQLVGWLNQRYSMKRVTHLSIINLSPCFAAMPLMGRAIAWLYLFFTLLHIASLPVVLVLPLALRWMTVPANAAPLPDGKRLAAAASQPTVPGVELDGVFGLCTLADADALSPRLARARQVVVIGAGFIGLEFAAVAAAKGLAVQVLELAKALAGKPATYTALPWFWTDQGDLRLQIAGLCDSHDQTVLLGSAERLQPAVLCFRAGRLVAAETCNRTPDRMAARKLLQRATPLTPQQAAEPGFDLKAYEAASRDAVLASAATH